MVENGREYENVKLKECKYFFKRDNTHLRPTTNEMAEEM